MTTETLSTFVDIASHITEMLVVHIGLGVAGSQTSELTFLGYGGMALRALKAAVISSRNREKLVVILKSGRFPSCHRVTVQTIAAVGGRSMAGSGEVFLVAAHTVFGGPFVTVPHMTLATLHSHVRPQ